MLSKIRIIEILFIILFSISILLSNLYVLFSNQYVNFEYSRKKFPDPENFSKNERLRISNIVVEYLNDKINFDKLESGGYFDERELLHIRDLKILKIKLLTLQFMLSIITIILGVSLYKIGNVKKFIDLLIKGFSLYVITILTLMVIILSNFNFFFDGFHKIFFKDMTWIFESTKTLIQLYPKKFWFDSTLIWILLSIFEIILLLILAVVSKKLINQRSNN